MHCHAPGLFQVSSRGGCCWNLVLPIFKSFVKNSQFVVHHVHSFQLNHIRQLSWTWLMLLCSLFASQSPMRTSLQLSKASWSIQFNVFPHRMMWMFVRTIYRVSKNVLYPKMQNLKNFYYNKDNWIWYFDFCKW